MATEDQFLQSIRAAPRDRALRLTYADWLEERGDLRANMVRIEEEMRSTAIHSDRYWQLKPQRHAFQDYCDEKHYDVWVAAMGYHRRYEPVFSDVPMDARSRWRLVREFIERWHGIRMPDSGGHGDLIRATESRLGQPLPASVAQWIALKQDLGTEFRTVFRDRFDVENMSRHHAVSVLILSEGDVVWGIRTRDLKTQDPPVQFYSTYQESRHAEPTGPSHQSLSAFALSHASYFLGRGLTQPSESPRVKSLARQHGLKETKMDGLSIFECENAIMFSDHNSCRIAIRGDIDESHLHPFFQEVLR